MTDSLGTTSYDYDIHGRLVKVTDTNGKMLQYAYDPRGLVNKWYNRMAVQWPILGT